MSSEAGYFSEPPSSPPPLPEYSLPEQPLRSRKRRAVDDRPSESNTSSDPFTFSSDDAIDPSIDNYLAPRRKKQYRGAWWGPTETLRVEPERRSHNGFPRNVDSGVWMGSESSSSSAEDQDMTETIPLQASSPGFGKLPASQDAPSVVSPTRLRKLSALEQHTPESIARSTVAECLETNHESVDLSGLSLSYLSDDMLRPLHSLIKYPHTRLEPPGSDEYQSFTPSIKLFLSRNELLKVPRELWTLRNITVLSLRNNNLTALSAAIANLQNLVELNVAGNQLRWLPCELLKLLGSSGKLTRLTVLPNPMFEAIRFHGQLAQEGQYTFKSNPGDMQAAIDALKAQPEESTVPEARTQASWLLKLLSEFKTKMDAQGSDSLDEASLISGSTDRYPWKLDPIYMASTPITYYDFDGTLAKFSNPSFKSLPRTTTLVPAAPPNTADPPPQEHPPSNQVPSLFETALRACTKLPGMTVAGLLSYLPPNVPENIIRGLHKAVSARQKGRKICSVCGRGYVMPRAEWIEYWHHVPDSLVASTDELWLPFLRRACSWGCARRCEKERRAVTNIL